MSKEKEDHEKDDKKDKTVTVIVNGRAKTVEKGEMTFEEIVALAFSPVPPNSIFTVTYSKGENGKSGTLEPGQSVKIKKDMIFNVTETGQS